MARFFALGAVAAAAMFAVNAQAASLTTQEIFEQFNVVTLGNMVTTSHVDGRTYVAGSLQGSNAVLGMHPQDMPKSNYAAVTVMGKGVQAGQAAVNNVQVTDYGIVAYGNITNSTINNGASAIYGSSTSTSFNGGSTVYASGGFSGGNVPNQLTSVVAGSLQATNTAAATSTDFAAKLGTLSTAMSKFNDTGSSVVIKDGLATFNAGVRDGIAVFDLTGFDEDLFNHSIVQEFQFNLNGATSVYLNSDVTSAIINDNFLDGSARSAGKSLIWNFYAATDLTINAEFGGNVLAVNANLLQTQNIEGGVYVNNLDSRNEIHLNPFIGAVPEPETYAMLLAGLGLVGVIARRRRQAGAR
jgi:choice-of-anchor A domain-containing protein